jgi:hypothetical protein
MAFDKLAPVGHNTIMQTVVETNYFASRVKKLLSEDERDDLINFIATGPRQGDILVGTGGLRKIRFARKGIGKSGGIRVIYYYHNANVPIYLLEVFGKNEKGNLSKAERNSLAKIVAEIKNQFKRRKQ